MSLQDYYNKRILNKINKDICDYIQKNYPFDFIYCNSLENNLLTFRFYKN